MSVITISRGSSSRGKEVAEKTAQKLGYDCISRDILLDACQQFNIPEIKLKRAIHDAPSILDRFTNGKERYIAYIQAALLKYLREDNIVYHGLAGHFFVKGVSHVLKVRIIADIEDRIRLDMEREKISYKQALHVLKKDDEQRRKWSLNLYGIDTADPTLYDLVIHIKKISADDAVDIICRTVQMAHFQTNSQSQKVMDDLMLAAEVKAALIELSPNVEVLADDGAVHVKARINQSRLTDFATQLSGDLEENAKAVPGVRDVKIEILPISIYN